MSELGDKVPAELKAQVQAAVEEVRKLKDSEDESAIRKAVDALSQVVQKVGVAAYQGKPEDGSNQKPGDDNVVDGEVKE